MNYTPEQLEIFGFVAKSSGHGIIDAVAGAGKTTTIIESAQYVPSGNKILFCAFNNAIADEIARKFSKKSMHQVTVKTIHALGFDMLRNYMRGDRQFALKENKYRGVVQSEKADEDLEEYFDKLVRYNNYSGLNPSSDRERFAVKRVVTNAKERLIQMIHKYRTTLEKDDIERIKAMVLHYNLFNAREAKSPTFNEELECYFACLKYYIKEGNELAENAMIIDFTDMLYLPYHWNLNPVTKYDFVYVDECQDLSRSQLNIVRLYRDKAGRVIAVGDPRQSIYGFNGADIESFDRVKRQFEPMEPLKLTTSFRCPQGVIELARKIRPDISGSKSEEGIVSSIQFHEITSMARSGDLIISRLKAPLLMLVFAFIEKDIKVYIYDDEVDSFIAEMKKLFKQEQLQVRIASHPGGFEEIKEDVIKRWDWIIGKEAEKIINQTERDIYIISETDYLHRKIEFLHKKYETWKPQCHTILDILKKIKEYISWKENPIKLSTIHRAKGLEHKRVFILNYDNMPHYRDGMKDWEKTQEENLKYVAVTRALEELYLVYSKDIDELIDEEDLFDDYPLVD